jgi:transposase InsO family protein
LTHIGALSWHTGSLLSTRERFGLAALAKKEPFAHLCRRFHVARSTGYKWLARFRRSGRAGLHNQSRRPQRSPRQLAPRWQLALRQLRRQHPTWGGRKLRARLRQLHPRVRLPAARTLSRWLVRLQLVPRKPRHQRRGPQLAPRTRTMPRCPNDVWTIDFKGWFRTGEGTRVEPLTVRDLKSRFLLDIRLLPNQNEANVHRAMLRIFRRYGLPKAIWADNGPPFGGVGPLGYSRLAVWWRRLGIRVEYGRPAHPQDNAAHEQMHGVYQSEVAVQPAAHPPAAQRQSNGWRYIYNQIRPHEALKGRTPAQLYYPSRRKLPRRLPAWTYPPHWQQKRVSADGRLFWRGRQRFVGRAFGGEIIGLQAKQPGLWKVYLGAELLGALHQQDRSRSLRPAQHVHH